MWCVLRILFLTAIVTTLVAESDPLPHKYKPERTSSSIKDLADVLESYLLAHLQHTNAHSRHFKFPPHFKFGAATSSYQIEGGWNEDGKGVSIWDRFSHVSPSIIKGNATGDVAADSYHRWRDDVRVAAEMGLHFYRFSIAWPRILPSGFNNEINDAGVRYYSDLIDALLANGIEPVITMYHWELPVAIQDMGGWTNPLIVKWFGDYARVVFSLYADRVKTWITINEAIVVCDLNYNIGNFAPGIREPEFAPYLCNKHVLLAHATAYRIYNQEFKEQYNGKLTLANNMLWVEPATPDDLELAELGRQHSMGRYLHPMLSERGGWPPNTEKAMLEYSLKKGYNESKLPSFTYEESKFIRGTIDFISINYYTTSVIRPAAEGETIGEWFISGSRELNAVITSPEDSYFGVSPILAVYPQGLRRQLNWLKRQYGDVEMLITENGFSTGGARLDRDRIHFINEHLKQVLLAIKDGVRVIGYSVWTMIDNFEWNDGYSTKFGLYEVDFESVEKVRTPRASAHYYSCVIQKHALNSSCLVRNHHLYSQNSASLLSSGLFTVLLLLIIALW